MINLLINQVLTMSLLMAIGYALFKAKLISSQGAKELGSILITLVIPAVIIRSFITSYTHEKLWLLAVSFLLSLLSLILAMLLAHLFYRRDGIAEFALSFSNAGFMGLPLVQAVLGEEAVFFVISYIALLNIFQWTYGVYRLTLDGKNIQLKAVLRNPVLIAFLIALILFITALPVPALIQNSLTLLANLNTPLAMLICGAYLAQTRLSNILLESRNYKVSFFRLILIPFVTFIILMLIPGYNSVKMAVFIAAMTPIGTNLAVFAQRYQKDYRYAVETICNSTLLSILTMPLWILIAEKYLR